ncbi:hypothetical protein [Streptomyces morookaense]|uniref:Uncharacterized protein n=1 Tax=Streptomyces morookaense TaxID=1970 RepID=A0A7Y7BA33_STRMO|nr:hypothetical protein [Streptomyces morookaense]NVK81624.1 hypothetical protein [Streptomyces morookaense]GHF09013.1 hypothetical protein GCM10010359_07950 [Streptomyces morookaense]
MSPTHPPACRSRHFSLRALITALVVILGLAVAPPSGFAASHPSPAPEKATPHVAKPRSKTGNRAGKKAPANTDLMTYHGGPVEAVPAVYIVYWGSQWTNADGSLNDPKGEVALQKKFFTNLVGSGDNWSTTNTQYCWGPPVTTGATSCPDSATHIEHLDSGLLAGTWTDTSAAVPANPTSDDIANEAFNAAAHFGVSGDGNQFIIDTPTGVTPQDFPNKYCSWHSSQESADGNTLVVYTNFPYMPDAGAQCGANWIDPGTTGVAGDTEGVTIVGGHEYAETLTDPEPMSGWSTDNDTTGGEIGDKCIWNNGVSAIKSIGGTNFAVQPLWSNNFNNGKGGCAIYYNSPTDQG